MRLPAPLPTQMRKSYRSRAARVRSALRRAEILAIRFDATPLSQAAYGARRGIA